MVLTVGHGHNYTFEVHVTGPIDEMTGMVMDLEQLKALIKEHVMDVFDHRHIDKDVPYFSTHPSTVENIALYIYESLSAVCPLVSRVVVFETSKNKAIFPPQ